MSIRFSPHSIKRLHERFPDPDSIRRIVRLVEEWLGARKFPLPIGTRQVIPGTVNFQPVRIVIAAVSAQEFEIVTFIRIHADH